MPEKPTLESVSSVIEEVLCVDASKITVDSRLIEDLDANSLDVVELAMALEERFELEIPDRDVDGLQTVGQVVEYLQGRLAKV